MSLEKGREGRSTADVAGGEGARDDGLADGMPRKGQSGASEEHCGDVKRNRWLDGEVHGARNALVVGSSAHLG